MRQRRATASERRTRRRRRSSTVTFDGRHRHPQRRAGRGRGRPADRARRSPPTSPARSTCTPPRAGARVRRRRRPTLRASPSTSPASVEVESPRPREGHRPARSPLSVDRRRRRSGPRDRRRQGPADLARAGHRRRGRGPDRLLHGARASPGASRATTPRPAAGPRPAWLGARGRLARACRGRAARARPGRSSRYVALAAVFGKDLLINPFFGMFYVLLWVGLVPARCSSARSGRRSARSARSTPLFARLSGGDPERGACYAYPERLGLLAGGARPVRLRVARAGLPPRHRARPGAAVVRGCTSRVMLIGGALFGNAFYEHADPFEVYSSLVGAALGLGPPRRRCWWSAARWPTSTTAGRARAWSPWSSVLFGSTAFDSFKDSTAVAEVRAVQSSSHRLLLDNLAARLLRWRSALVFAAGTMATGVGRTTRRPRAARPVRALGGADRRRLHRRPLPHLPRRGRPADADPAQRPVQQRRATASAPPTWR